MRGKLIRTFLLAFGILIACIYSFSQIREAGSIQGHVTDLDGAALSEVTITVESPGLIGGPRYTITDDSGFFKFSSLYIGVYKVKAELPGFMALIKEGIKLHANVTLTVDFKITQATLREEIVVLGDIPTVDVKSSSTGSVVLTDELLTSIPSSKNFEWILNLRSHRTKKPKN